MLGPQTNLVTRYLDLLSQSQRVTATNIANADTPGYRTRQVEFGAQLRAALDNPAGISGAEQAPVRELGTLPVKNDGNDVVLERELQQLLFQSQDAKEGIAAYVEKRKAQFQGK